MTSKSDAAYSVLRERIISGAIAPDVPLRIQALGDETGFGSTPVREALRRLEAESLVVSEVNVGFRSASISIDEVRDLENSRLVIETAMLEASIAQGDDVWESRIVAAHYQLAKLDLPIDTTSPEAQSNWSEKHQAFHDALLAASRSKWLRSFQTQIAEQLERNFRFTMGEPLQKRLQESEEDRALLRQALGIEHHTLLMQAALDRDGKSAIALLEEHIQFASTFFARIYS